MILKSVPNVQRIGKDASIAFVLSYPFLFFRPSIYVDKKKTEKHFYKMNTQVLELTVKGDQRRHPEPVHPPVQCHDCRLTEPVSTNDLQKIVTIV